MRTTEALIDINNTGPNTPVVLVGTKEDLRYDEEYLLESQSLNKDFNFIDPAAGDEVSFACYYSLVTYH